MASLQLRSLARGVDPSPLVDLLDRVLEKGLFLSADVLITLAGVPLLGIKLRALMAGVETMLRYGLIDPTDAGVRAE